MHLEVLFVNQATPGEAFRSDGDPVISKAMWESF